MGIIRAGILSRVSGKVGGVVGASWKDKAYLREYIIPANPNTTPQQVQRTLMRIGVAFGKALTGPVFNAYTDKFERGMSGFNRFIKDNMRLFLSPITFASIKLTNGKLWRGTFNTPTSASHSVTVTWSPTSLGNNGAATDTCFAAVYDVEKAQWFFASAAVARSTGTITVPMVGGSVGHTAHVYAWFAKYSVTSPTLLEMISDSGYGTCTVIGAQ